MNPCSQPQQSVTAHLAPLSASSTPASRQGSPWSAPLPPPRRCHKAPCRFHGGYILMPSLYMATHTHCSAYSGACTSKQQSGPRDSHASQLGFHLLPHPRPPRQPSTPSSSAFVAHPLTRPGLASLRIACSWSSNVGDRDILSYLPSRANSRAAGGLDWGQSGASLPRPVLRVNAPRTSKKIIHLQQVHA